MRSFSCSLIAKLVYGLRDTSRIKMKMSGLTVDIDRLLLARIADNTAIGWWIHTEGARKGENQPKSCVQALTGKVDDASKAVPFESAEAFEKERKRLLNEC